MPGRNGRCNSRLLVDFTEKDLDPRLLAEIELHTLRCRSCQNLIRELMKQGALPPQDPFLPLASQPSLTAPQPALAS
ncbi:MAG: hypothetical protein HY652_07265 [Acidobacteria bacterium]|nr:hypothetical protein [Acidobacteriota bacterium]